MRVHGWETKMGLKHSGPRRLEAGAVEAFRDKSLDDPRADRDGAVDRDLSLGGTRYSARAPVARKLDHCKGVIDVRLAEPPKLSAKRSFDEVQAAGYEGGYSRLRAMLADLKIRGALDSAGAVSGHSVQPPNSPIPCQSFHPRPSTSRGALQNDWWSLE